jgi:hypothetical protein
MYASVQVQKQKIVLELIASASPKNVIASWSGFELNHTGRRGQQSIPYETPRDCLRHPDTLNTRGGQP